jgi:hypothetical protein
MLNHGFAHRRNPVLSPLDSIETMDALLDRSNPTDPREAEWPPAEFIVGNPSFLGNRFLRRKLGSEYTEALWAVLDARLPPWVLAGAAVHISFIGQDDSSQRDRELDGDIVATINPDLTTGVDLTKARRLPENANAAFMGDIKVGPFDIEADLARSLIATPNPDGRSNRDVVRPWVNGRGQARTRPRGSGLRLSRRGGRRVGGAHRRNL